MNYSIYRTKKYIVSSHYVLTLLTEFINFLFIKTKKFAHQARFDYTTRMNHQAYILVLYYSKHGSTKALAEEIALGIESQGTFEARLRTVNPIKNAEEINETLTDDLLVTMDDLRHCAGLALGSPTHFGNMAGAS